MGLSYSACVHPLSGHMIISSTLAQVNHCHEEQLAKMKQEMVSKNIKIAQFELQNKHLVSYSDELETQTEQKETEKASKDEQIALLQLGSKELTDLQEEIQAKNQQVKQYKKQVDSYKAELERCQGEMLEVNVTGATYGGIMIRHVCVCLMGAHTYLCCVRCVYGMDTLPCS